MAEKEQVSKSAMSADWFLRGALTKIGDTFDRLTGRRWVPSSSLATSELIERMKKLLDSEARNVPGKGLVVPHNIKLKMQWDKFSTDSEDALTRLRNELLAAAADHINDSLYYTYAPLTVEVKPDYFTEGVKLFVGFDKFSKEEQEVEMNVTIAGIQIEPEKPRSAAEVLSDNPSYVAHFQYKGYPRQKNLDLASTKRISIGRTANNGLVLDDESVSKIHAALVIGDDGSISVADTGSTNGTFINGKRISYGKAVRLADGDKLRFGTVEVTLEKVERAAQTGVSESIEGEGFDFVNREHSASLEDTAKIDDVGSKNTSDPMTETNGATPATGNEASATEPTEQ